MSEIIDQLNAALAGRYAIQRELGSGGMATVFLAQDLRAAGGEKLTETGIVIGTPAHRLITAGSRS